MHLRIITDPGLSPEVNQDEEEKWDRKLSGKEIDESGEVREFPLAPKELERLKRVTPQNYKGENERIGKFSSDLALECFVPLLYRVGLEEMERQVVSIFGIGTARDWGFVPQIFPLVRRIDVFDASGVAIANGERVVPAEAIASHRIKFRHQTLDCLTGYIDLDCVFSYAASFVQILKRGTPRGYAPTKELYRAQEQWLFDYGRYLSHRAKKGLPAELLLIHAVGSDNNKPVIWDGLELPGAEWGDTTPLEVEEIEELVAAGSNRPIEVTVLRKGTYYHHVYSGIRIRCAG